MRKACTFLGMIDGVAKWFESYAFDRQEAIAQLKEIYTEESEIEVYCFRHL